MSNASANRKKMFDVIGQEPLMWLEQAQELKLCADMMWQELQSIAHVSQVLAGIRVKKLALFNGYMLLTGFAFENVIKGLIVAQGISTATGALSPQLKSHDLMKLATSANLNLSDTELGFLRRLQEFTIWAGRYPIALDAQKYADGEKYLNLSANDVGLADQLFQSLETMLRNQRKPPKDW